MQTYKEPTTAEDRELIRLKSKVIELSGMAWKRNIMTRPEYARLLCKIPAMVPEKAQEWIDFFTKKGL